MAQIPFKKVRIDEEDVVSGVLSEPPERCTAEVLNKFLSARRIPAAGLRKADLVKLAEDVVRNKIGVAVDADKVTDDMELKSSCGSDRAWVWSTLADVSDGKPNPEVLAIRFQNSTAAHQWKDKFEEAKDIVAKGLNKSGEKKDEEKDNAASGTSESDHSGDDEPSKEMSKLSLTTETEKKEDKSKTVIGEEETLQNQ